MLQLLKSYSYHLNFLKILVFFNIKALYSVFPRPCTWAETAWWNTSGSINRRMHWLIQKFQHWKTFVVVVEKSSELFISNPRTEATERNGKSLGDSYEN